LPARPLNINSISQMETGRLTIKRPRQYADMIRRYGIFVDGALAGTMKAGEELALNIPTGEHQVVARIDWCGSNVLNVTVRPDETTEVEVGSNAMTWAGLLALYYVTFARSKYLYLRLAPRGFRVLPPDPAAR
jgi:hypothetical protein